MTQSRIRGQKGEAAAVRHLLSLGYRIDGTNVRFGRYELDIIAFDTVEKMMVFAEVKTRSRSSESYPIRTAMTGRKRIAIRKAVDRWMMHHDYDGPARIDLLCVAQDRIVEHLKDLGSDFF